jgi:hypothetical protein
MKLWTAGPLGCVAPSVFDPGKRTCSSRHARPPETSRHGESQRHGWIEMRSADISERVDHRQNHQAKGERNARMADRTGGNRVDHDRARAGKDETKSAQTFREQTFHD